MAGSACDSTFWDRQSNNHAPSPGSLRRSAESRFRGNRHRHQHARLGQATRTPAHAPRTPAESRFHGNRHRHQHARLGQATRTPAHAARTPPNPGSTEIVRDTKMLKRDTRRDCSTLAPTPNLHAYSRPRPHTNPPLPPRRHLHPHRQNIHVMILLVPNRGRQMPQQPQREVMLGLDLDRVLPGQRHPVLQVPLP